MNSKSSATARTHLRLNDAAKRLAHCRRWVREKIAAGELEGFKHASNDMTVSLESIIAYEARARISQIPPR